MHPREQTSNKLAWPLAHTSPIRPNQPHSRIDTNIQQPHWLMLGARLAGATRSCVPLARYPLWRGVRAVRNIYKRSATRQASMDAATTASVAAAAGDRPATLVWLRPGDLRLVDHEPLYTAALSLSHAWNGQQHQQLQQQHHQHHHQQQRQHQQQQAVEPRPALLLPFLCLDDRDLLPRAEPPDGIGVPTLGPYRLR